MKNSWKHGYYLLSLLVVALLLLQMDQSPACLLLKKKIITKCIPVVSATSNKKYNTDKESNIALQNGELKGVISGNGKTKIVEYHLCIL